MYSPKPIPNPTILSILILETYNFAGRIKSVPAPNIKTRNLNSAEAGI